MSRARQLLARCREDGPEVPPSPPVAPQPQNNPLAGQANPDDCAARRGIAKLAGKIGQLEAAASLLNQALQGGEYQERVAGLSDEDVDTLIYRLLNSSCPTCANGQNDDAAPVTIDSLLADLGSYPDQPAAYPVDLADEVSPE